MKNTLTALSASVAIALACLGMPALAEPEAHMMVTPADLFVRPAYFAPTFFRFLDQLKGTSKNSKS